MLSELAPLLTGPHGQSVEIKLFHRKYLSGLGSHQIQVHLAAILVALPADLLRIEGTFLVLGSLFIPLFGVVIADQMAGREGNRFGPVALGAWVLGFLAYHWISPPDGQWWRDATDWFFSGQLGLPYPLTDEVDWLDEHTAACAYCGSPAQSE